MSEVIWTHTIEESDFYSLKERLLYAAVLSPIAAAVIWYYSDMPVIEAAGAALVLGLLLIFFDQGAMSAKDQRRFIVLTSNALRISSEGYLLSGTGKVYRFGQVAPNTIKVKPGMLGTSQLKFSCTGNKVTITFPDKKSALACLIRLRRAVEEYNN
ncbi:hypothetical protein [Kangiella shandongensis]|uniref:hypothetical protein n=1 Tax=Kangiella shandongensis TaxID=2763258 RepID=UPI001CBE31F9|nr:hypothetical protein [Kangiella shandongensis]